jgi:hypothetical protein
MVLDEHLVTLFEASRHKVVPAPAGVVKPFKVKKLPVPVLIVTLSVPVGVKIEEPLAIRPLLKVPVEEKAEIPVTPKDPPRVVAPVPTLKVLEPVIEVAPFRTVKPLATKLELKMPVPVKVELPVTDRVEDKAVVPVTDRDEATVVAPFRVTLPEPVVNVPVPLWLIFPKDWERLLAKADDSVTEREPPRVVAPVPTLKVFAPVTEVLPFNETLPVPVENDPVPDCVIFPKV